MPRDLTVSVRLVVRVDDGSALARHVGSDRPHPVEDVLVAVVDTVAAACLPGMAVVHGEGSLVAATRAVAPVPVHPPDPGGNPWENRPRQ